MIKLINQINNRNIDCMKQKFDNRNLIEIFKNKKIKFSINKIIKI